MAKVQGWEYHDLIGRIVDEALSRSTSRQAANALVEGALPVT